MSKNIQVFNATEIPVLEKVTSISLFYSPATVEEIIERALGMVGEIGYNVLWSNCEHFASYCRYGKAKSDQVGIFYIVLLPKWYTCILHPTVGMGKF